MIKYQFQSGGIFPRIFCDECSKPIDDEKSFALWDKDGNVAHAHQGNCVHKLSRTTPLVYSDSLVTFLANLLHNTGINPKKLKPDALWDESGVVESREKLNRGAK
jgi:hypothetical protein